jgi:hypothetical protein
MTGQIKVHKIKKMEFKHNTPGYTKKKLTLIQTKVSFWSIEFLTAVTKHDPGPPPIFHALGQWICKLEMKFLTDFRSSWELNFYPWDVQFLTLNKFNNVINIHLLKETNIKQFDIDNLLILHLHPRSCYLKRLLHMSRPFNICYSW